MKLRSLRKPHIWLISLIVVLLAVTAVKASFSPASGITFSASAYVDRAKLANSTGISSLATYASPATCPARVNLFSQNVEYTVPLFSLIGRAGLSLNLALTYNSKAWTKSGTTMHFDGEQGWPAPGWRMGFGRMDGKYAPSGSDINEYFYIAPDGAIHDLHYNSSDGLYESTDSSYLDFNDSTGVLRLKDGTQITFARQGGTGGYVLATQVKDPNGNYITVNYSGTGQQISSIVDTVNRTVSFSYNSDGTLASISKSGFGNASRTWSFSYSSLTLSYSFAPSLTVNAPTSVKVLSSITFPNSTSQTFSYNGYGQLTEMDVKSSSSTVRGKILVSWQSAPSGGWTTSPTPATVANNDGSTTNIWSLSFGDHTTTVTDPNGTATTTTFINDSGIWDDGLPNQQQIGSTALRTSANTWGSDSSSLNPRITQVLTTLNDTSQQWKIQTDYTTYGNPSEIREYDFGLTLVRKTVNTYVTDSNYTSRHILGLRASSIVYDGAGTAASKTTFTYDGSSLTSATGASNHDDTNYGTGFAYRGLMSSTTQYTDPITPSGAVTHSATYDMLGNTRTATADCCAQQQFNYSSTTQFSQPDSGVSGSGTTLTVSGTYDSYTGLLASSTDANSQTTTYNYDVMDRLTSVTRPDGTAMSTAFDDSSANPGMTVTTPITSSTNMKSTTTYDGLMRPIRATVLDASSSVYSKVDTQYDGLGQGTQVSMPYTGSSASYWTQTQYDALGRITKVIPADGSSSSNNVSFSYSGNAVTTTDSAGKQSKTISNAAGSVTEVDQPDPSNSNSLTLATTYTYNPLDEITQIVQGSQTRTYAFDGLGRETSETTPESGTISYQYNSTGKVTQRTDARGVVTTYSYDSTLLNRLTGISYNVSGATGVPSTPSVSYTYGTSSSSYNNGRLITMSDGVGSESYTYDQLGRRSQAQKTVNNVVYTTSYTYNLAGNVVTMTYPSGRVVKNYYDAIGRGTGVQNNSNSAYYASSVGYDTANDVTGFTYGNGVVASFGYSPQRLQLTSIAYTEGSTPLLSLSFGYSQSGGNNGQLASITDSTGSGGSGRSATYAHDALGRLTAASTSGSSSYPAWGLAFSYDRYGNRTSQSVTAGSGYASSPTINTSKNQISSVGGHTYTYDASGNLTEDDLYKYVCDAENRLVEIDHIAGGAIGTFAYDGNSNRIVKVVDASRSIYIYAGSMIISEFEDAASNTYSSGTTPNPAVDDYYATLLYHHQDQVSTRLTTDNSGVLASYQGHYPFGEPWYGNGVADASVEQKYAAYLKEFEVDNAMLNYAASRFVTARNGQYQTMVPGRQGATIPPLLNPYPNGGDDPLVDPSLTGQTSPGDKPNPPRDFSIIDISGGTGCVGCGPGFGVFGGLRALDAYFAAQNRFSTFLNNALMGYNENTGNFDRKITMDDFINYYDPGSFLTGIRYLPQAPADKSSIVEWIKYEEALQKWWQAILSWSFSAMHGGQPLNPAPTATANCNLQSQVGSTCNYTCRGGGLLFSTYSTTLGALATPCSLASTTTTCPNSIILKGLTPTSATVSSCSN